jgi:hypothetical protein
MHPKAPAGPRPLRLAALVATAALLPALAPATGRASIIISVQSVSAAAGSTGNALEVTLQNTGPSDVTVGGFSFEIMAATADINFTSATTGTTTATYIFDGNSSFGPNIETSTGQTLDASDSFATIGMGATIGAGDTVGLGHVLFDVAGTAAPGPITVTLSGPPATSLATPAPSSDIPIDDLIGGTITVTGSVAAVPEPSTLAGAATGVILALGCAWRRRRARAAA